MDRPGTRSGGTATGAPTRAPIPTAADCSPRPRTSRCTSPAAPTTTPASSATGKTTISLSFELGRCGIFVQFCDLRVLRIAFSICCTEKHDFESAFFIFWNCRWSWSRRRQELWERGQVQVTRGVPPRTPVSLHDLREGVCLQWQPQVKQKSTSKPLGQNLSVTEFPIQGANIILTILKSVR